MTTPAHPTQPYIVFGYGSLMFKPPPNVVKQTPGYIKGYVRRFAQSSTDHRGTPEAPGRVVTLIPVDEWESLYGHESYPGHDIVWGVAYTIDPDPAKSLETHEYLEYREKEGYTVHIEDIYAADGSVAAPRVQVYVGRSDNPAFIGAEPLDQLAEHIWRSVGPSGRNKDYFYGIARHVRELAPDSDDPYLFALERRIRTLDEESDAPA
ncbi:ChaC-like protein [Exidia glandulosa HHB12029]|uniref:glutathione-specific gamma-glutamylcyclotransferase n=1 Tax=Exidia glandulosa HHB12029 TaxID=1314781 RepID=A0A165BEQ0_EXIGL|nr:ChaC-like protein [Exidia glandulosa HHB12029]